MHITSLYKFVNKSLACGTCMNRILCKEDRLQRQRGSINLTEIQKTTFKLLKIQDLQGQFYTLPIKK